MRNTIKNKWWQKWFDKLNYWASYLVAPSARERYRIQQSCDQNERIYGAKKTHKTRKD